MVFYSEYDDITPVERPVHEVVLEHAAEFGDRPAMIDGSTGDTLTYAQLDHDTRRTAAGFAEAGMGKGDVAAIYSPNSLAYPIAFYSASRTGACVSPVSSLATVDDLTKQLVDSRARWIITVSGLLDQASAAAERAAAAGVAIREIFVCDQAEGHRSLKDVAATDAPEPTPDIDPVEDVAILPYSSGTTGAPKGVMLTHRNVVTNLEQIHAVQKHQDGDCVFGAVPFFHIYGTTAMMNQPLRHGITVVMLPRFDLEQFLSAVGKYRVTGAYVAPPVVLALAKHPSVDDYDLSSLQWIASAAAPLDAELIETCLRRVGVKTILQAYGMTELSPGTHLMALDEENPPPGAVGKMAPSTEMRVVSVEDPDKDLGVNEEGELLFRGPQVMKGYLGRPEATAAMIDADGWLHTGDVGRVDEKGYLYIVDRLKELIKYKGYQVAPAELEAVLLTHPSVADAAVIGVEDAEAGEIPKAFVVRKPGTELTEDDVMAHVAGQVAPYKKVRAVEFLDAVPKAPSGKILRRELRDRERERKGE